jgi:hypothetical protein
MVAAALAARLHSTGRAEAHFERRATDPLTGRLRVARGEIAFEPRDRVSLKFPSTGERITVRADGGEWLQPALHQMLLLDSAHASVASRWWGALLPGGGQGVVARDLGRGRALLIASGADSSGADSAWVWLDGRGLPARLEVREEAGSPTVYRLSGWRFPRARGVSAFRIEAPAGYEVVKLP